MVTGAVMTLMISDITVTLHPLAPEIILGHFKGKKLTEKHLIKQQAGGRDSFIASFPYFYS